MSICLQNLATGQGRIVKGRIEIGAVLAHADKDSLATQDLFVWQAVLAAGFASWTFEPI